MTYRAPADTKVGHIHLKVSDLERSIAFYRDVLGFHVTLLYGKHAAFMAAGDYHHHIGLNTWESLGAGPVQKKAAGMYHVAFVYPDRTALGEVVRHVRAAGVDIYGAADHGVSEAVYFDDPDGNGIELYWDRDRSTWDIGTDGTINLVNTPLDIDALIADARSD